MDYPDLPATHLAISLDFCGVCKTSSWAKQHKFVIYFLKKKKKKSTEEHKMKTDILPTQTPPYLSPETIIFNHFRI